MVLLSPLRWLSPLHWVLLPLRIAQRVVSLLVSLAVVYLGFSAYQVVNYASGLAPSPATVARSGAIVLLGAPLKAGAPGPELQLRLGDALTLYQAKISPRIFVTGPRATVSGAPTVTGVSVRWLVVSGVPRSAIRVVVAADPHTALDVLGSRLGPGTKVAVVTDAVDAFFVEQLATGAGLVAQIFPTSDSQRSLPSLLGGFGSLWRETTAVALGRVVGYGRIGWAGG